MMKEHFLKAISDLFTMLDKNKNRVIDKIEQEEAMKQIHSMALPKARWTWSAMDTDGDGKISENEFQEGMQAISDEIGEEKEEEEEEEEEEKDFKEHLKEEMAKYGLYPFSLDTEEEEEKEKIFFIA